MDSPTSTPEPTEHVRLRELLAKAEAAAVSLKDALRAAACGPCLNVEFSVGGVAVLRCLDRARGPWPMLDPQKMCRACAACWHAGAAEVAEWNTVIELKERLEEANTHA